MQQDGNQCQKYILKYDNGIHESKYATGGKYTMRKNCIPEAWWTISSWKKKNKTSQNAHAKQLQRNIG